MSHFSVLVIGDNVEKQLAPYHEFECTGVNDEYVQDIDITSDVLDQLKDGESLEDALDYYGLGEKVVSDESDVDTSAEHKFGYAIVKDGKLVKAVDRTNPNKKWDWYVIGGRWGAQFPLKKDAKGLLGSPSTFDIIDGDSRDKTKVDQARKGDIDWERLFADKRKDAISCWDEWEREENKDWVNAYFVYGIKKDETREQYIERQSKFSTFAVVKDSKWYERGEMGWWGCVSNEKSADEWNAEFDKLIAGLPGDTFLTIVDCHI